MHSSRKTRIADNQTSKPIKLLIADGLDIFRLGVLSAFSTFANVEILADCADGEAAVTMTLRLNPDLVIMDLDLPVLDGLSALAQIKARAPQTLVLISTNHDDNDLILAALGAGANGYCLKDLSSDKLLLAIHSVLAGHRWIDARVTSKLSRLTASWQKKLENRPLKQIAIELKILQLIENGATSQEIAQQLGLGESELTKIIKRMVNKLIVSGELQSSHTLSNLRKAKQESADQASQDNVNREQTSKQLLKAIPAILKTENAFAGRYKLLSVLGMGGMGIVYKAMHLHMERTVAIKVLHPESATDPKVIARLKRESKAISALNHPNIVNVHDFGVTDGGQPYLVMDYVQGISLDDIFQQRVPVTAKQYAQIFIQVCDGLAATHAKGLVHCDLKPSNIMLYDNGRGEDRVKILDFGLVRFLPTSMDVKATDSFEVAGSPLYMSPEQCNGGTLDPRSDIYSLGCIMYEAFTGKPVFDGTTPYKVFSQHFGELPKPFIAVQPSQLIDEQLEVIVFKALEKDPENRFTTALELKEALLSSCTELACK